MNSSAKPWKIAEAQAKVQRAAQGAEPANVDTVAAPVETFTQRGANGNVVKEFACDYLQNKWPPIKLKPRSKEPPGGHVLNTVTSDNVEKLSVADNIGVRFTRAGPLKDFDLDYQAAADLAKEVGLTGATAGFGRETVGIGHLLYNAPGCDAKKFELPESDAYPRSLPIHDGLPSRLVLEIRGADNTYTMFPPSIHPETGETLEWNGHRREPADITAEELHTLAGRHAVAATALYFYPDDATARYDVRMALSGALIKSGMNDDLSKLYVQAVARLAGDPKWNEDFVKSTGKRLKAGKAATGLPKLVKTLRLPKDCEGVFRDWLRLGNALQIDDATIVMRDGAVNEIVDKAEAALISAGVPIYKRGEELVMPIKGKAAGGSITRAAEATSLFAINTDYLVELMHGSAKWARWAKQGDDIVAKRADPATKYAKQLLSRPHSKWKFPSLLGVINAPTLGPKGDIIETPGYDATSELLLDFKVGAFPPVPQNPTKADAEAALKKIEYPLRDFPFDGETADIKISPSRSVALSAMLSALIRPSLRTVPLHGFDAPTAGTGKSLLADAPAILASGTKPVAMAQGKTPEEDEKRLSTVLHAGDAVIMIDNCERPVHGDFLCMMLTQETVQARILGQSQRRLLPCTALVVCTGNNLTFAGDVTRRAVRCVIDAKQERPDQREFDFDFLEELRAGRAELVVAGLTILRAYHLAGRPQADPKLKPMGSFDDWMWVRGALKWLGQKDPAESRDAILEADPRKAELAEVLAAWEKAFGKESKTLAEIGRTPKDEVSDVATLKTLLAEASGRGGAWNARSVGWFLRRISKRIIAGRCFEPDDRPEGKYWKIRYLNQIVKDEKEPGKNPRGRG